MHPFNVKNKLFTTYYLSVIAFYTIDEVLWLCEILNFEFSVKITFS